MRFMRGKCADDNDTPRHNSTLTSDESDYGNDILTLTSDESGYGNDILVPSQAMNLVMAMTDAMRNRYDDDDLITRPASRAVSVTMKMREFIRHG